MIRYICIVLLFLVSCSVFDGKDDTSKIEFERAWEVVEIIDEDGNTIPLIDKSKGGEAACNLYGEYIANKSGNLTIKNLFATEIACPQPSFGDEEKLTFLKGLNKLDLLDSLTQVIFIVCSLLIYF